MHYFEAYQFFLRGPKWALNLVFGALCVLVPVAGPMVLMGWAFEVLSKRRPEGYGGPVFDVNKLGTYIMRGVWPFLVQLVITVVVFPVVYGLWAVVFVSTVVAGGPKAGQPPQFPWLLFPAYFLTILVIVVAINLISLPMCLRAGFIQDFVPAFNFKWTFDFIKRVWAEMLLSLLFLLVTAPFIAIAGLLLCCVGYLPALAWISLAHYHLWFQLYDLYLERGGEAIPMKAEPVHPMSDDSTDTHFRPKES
jgi:hypothetical protein